MLNLLWFLDSVHEIVSGSYWDDEPRHEFFDLVDLVKEASK